MHVAKSVHVAGETATVHQRGATDAPCSPLIFLHRSNCSCIRKVAAILSSSTGSHTCIVLTHFSDDKRAEKMKRVEVSTHVLPRTRNETINTINILTASPESNPNALLEARPEAPAPTAKCRARDPRLAWRALSSWCVSFAVPSFHLRLASYQQRYRPRLVCGIPYLIVSTSA